MTKLPTFHEDTLTDHSIAAALDGDYTRLRQRLLTITQEELNLIAEARSRGCKECRAQLVTREELDRLDAILAELQATGRVSTPRAKVQDARAQDNLAFTVVQVEREMRLHWPHAPQGFWEEAYRYVEHISCGRRKYSSIKKATLKFRDNLAKMAFADKTIAELHDQGVRIWHPLLAKTVPARPKRRRQS